MAHISTLLASLRNSLWYSCLLYCDKEDIFVEPAVITIRNLICWQWILYGATGAKIPSVIEVVM